MEVKASCIRLWLTVSILLVGLAQKCYSQTSDTALRIVPSKLQFFEYESISFTCEGLTSLAGWRVRSMNETIKKCSNDTVNMTVTCILDFAYEPDSGEYWCEGGGGRKSNTVNIAVTAGSVILESPALPVREGESMTMNCRTRDKSSNSTAEFYRDGFLVQSSATGQMTTGNIRKSDEGFYTCKIAPFGTSPNSWLAVKDRDVIMESPVTPVKEGEAVTLRCRGRNISYTKAEFYKDGVLISSSSTGKMTMHRVSKSDEGVYKCHITGAGESAERQLLVKAASRKATNTSYIYLILLWLFVTVILVLELQLIRLLYRKKQLVMLESKLNDQNKNLQLETLKEEEKERCGRKTNLLTEMENPLGWL